jgi:hypothetical protein
MTGLQVFQILKARMGEPEAEAFVTYVDTTLQGNRREMASEFRSIFATKEDLAQLRGELTTELASVRGNLEVKISDVKSDVMRWMFAFFITTLLAILGLYFKK